MPFRSGHPLVKLAEEIGARELLAWHERHGANINASEYFQQYRAVLAGGIQNVRRIYLDTNYWVRLRQAATGDRIGVFPDLLEAIRHRVRERSAICVTQFWNFMELGKQHPDSLRTTAAIVDELTDGVALIGPDEQRSLQIAEFVASFLGADVDFWSDRWTWAGFFARNSLPQNSHVASQATAEAVAKTMIDTTVMARTSTLFEAFNWDFRNVVAARPDLEKVLQGVEAVKSDYRAKKSSRDAVRLNEFGRVLNEQYSHEIVRQIWRFWGRPITGRELMLVTSAAIEKARQLFRKRELKHFLPEAAITADLFALYVQDEKRRSLTYRDYIDWNHAAASIPSVNIFLTEKHLAHQLRILGIDTAFDCQVLASPEEAVKLLS